MRSALVGVGVLLIACGSADQAADVANPPALRVVFTHRDEFTVQSATTATSPPLELVFRFLGPDGAVEKRIAYDIGRLALDDLRVGTWRVSGEGLDGDGLVTWEASPVVFEVSEDRTTQVDLVFQPL